MKHPIQPLYTDTHGTLRFKPNAIVSFLLDAGPFDLNQLAIKQFSFSQEDREQFAQLIGYSLSGFGELSYVSDATYAAANNMHANGQSEDQARIAHLEAVLDQVRTAMRDVVPALFRIHVDDLDV